MMIEEKVLSVGDTIARRTRGISLDWFRCSLPDNDHIWERLQVWFPNMTKRDCGWSHGWYPESWLVLDNGGMIARCVDPDMVRDHLGGRGILIDLSGRGCAVLADSLWPFVVWCLGFGKVSRADFAIDDREGLVTRERVEAALRDGHIVTRWRKAKMNAETSVKSGKDTSYTRYFGSRTSGALLRIYDKAAQQNVSGHWMRVELEAHDALADYLCRAWVDEGFQPVLAELNTRIRFVIPGETDSNRRRWKTAAWWYSLVGSAKRVVALIASKVETTIEQSKTWVSKYAIPAILSVVLAEGGSVDWLYTMLKESRGRLRPKHYHAIACA